MRGELFVFVSAAISRVFSNCHPKDVTLVNFEKNPKRSAPFILEVSAKKCPGQSDFYYKWELKESESPEIILAGSRPSFYINGYEIPESHVFETSYTVKVEVSHYSDLSWSSLVSATFRFAADEMKIRIVGGSERTHLAGDDLTLDAETQSRDFSYSPKENAFKGDSVYWTVSPNTIKDLPKNLIITVPGKKLQVDQVYKFTVHVKRTKITSYVDEKTAVQTVTITSPSSPELSLKCEKNCESSHPKEVTVMKVVCVKNCKNLNYKWSVEPEVDKSKIEFGDGFDKIIIKPNVFKPGEKVTFRVDSGSAHNTYDLTFLEDVKNGTCSVEPKKGISGFTLFRVKCQGFASHEGILMYEVFQKDDDINRLILLNEDKTLEECVVYLSAGSPATIVVKIQDSAYMDEEIQLTVEVEPFTAGLNGKSEIKTVKAVVLGDNADSIISMAEEGFRDDVIQKVSLLLNALKDVKNADDSVVEDLYKHMAESILQVTTLSFPSAVQTTLILLKMEKFKLKKDTLTSRIMSETMLMVAKAMRSASELPIPIMLLYNAANDIFELSSDLLAEVDELDEILKNETQVHEYDSYDELVSEKLKIRDDMRNSVGNIMISLEILGMVFAERGVRNETETLFEQKGITFTTKKVATMSLKNETISIPNVTQSNVYLPDALVKELYRKGVETDYQFAVFKNPFWWDENNWKINTDIIHFGLYRNFEKIKNVKNAIRLNLKTKNIPTGILKGTIDNTTGDVVAFRIKIDSKAEVIVQFNSSDHVFNVTSAPSYCNKTDFLLGKQIKPGSSTEERTLHVRAAEGKDHAYVCVLKMESAPLEYEAAISSFSCVFWDLNAKKWTSDACTVREASLEEGSFLQCDCTHLSFFAGELFVPPNKINFNKVFTFHIGFVKNWFMVITVLGILLLWALLLILTIRRDRNLKKKNVVYKLDDNVPGDPHVYLMVVFTGIFVDAETSADVAFQIIGEKAKSRVHLIKCSRVQLLQRNSQAWFLVYTPHHLGQLQKIRLWHNCKGAKPHWYCKRILIEELETGEQFCFIVEKWFSLIWGSGKIYREIPVREKVRLKKTKLLFFVNLETKFKDKHLWLSVWTREAHSNFTSVERVSCCICFLLLSMMTSAMFFDIPTGTPKDSIDRKESFIIDLEEIMIFIETLVITAPASIILALLFRNSAPYRNKKKTKKKQRTDEIDV